MDDRREPRRPTTQEDLAAILGNPEALRLLAFGAKTMGRFVETSRTMSRLAFEATGLAPASLTNLGTPASGRSRSGEEPQAPPGAGVPEGTMLVPVDAWNRILDQLGHLHEAGQDLAEARERAARAETTAEFQAERRQALEEERDRLVAEIAELRTEAAEPPPPDAPAPVVVTTTPEPPAPAAHPDQAATPVAEAPAATNGASSQTPTRTGRLRNRLIRILEG